jgi:hypothetical protein
MFVPQLNYVGTGSILLQYNSKTNTGRERYRTGTFFIILDAKNIYFVLYLDNAGVEIDVIK